MPNLKLRPKTELLISFGDGMIYQGAGYLIIIDQGDDPNMWHYWKVP